MPQLGERRRIAAEAHHEGRRIARHDVQHQKDDDGRRDQRKDEGERPAGEKARHGHGSRQ